MTDDIKALSEPVQRRLEEKYLITITDLTPKVFYRITDNWLELTVRFIVHEHGVRDVKDAMSRAILERFEHAGIEVASATFELVSAPPLQVDISGRRRTADGAPRSRRATH